jgi:hypothetical protein
LFIRVLSNPSLDIIASGWQPRLFKQTQIADSDRAQLEQWAKAATQQQSNKESKK